MSQMPAVGIYGRIELQRQKLQQDCANVVNDLKQLAANVAKIPLNIPLTIDTKGLQAKATAAIASIKIPPINVPINFVPAGMPGIGGGMQAGASSPNWAYYFGGLQQQLQAMTPTSSPNWSMLLGGRGGPGLGGGGGSNLFNPFSPRGLARLMGSGLAVYGTLAATNLATGLAEANQISSHPERILRGFDKIGGTRDVTSDPVMIQQAAQIAGIQGQKKIVETIESVPLLGTLVKFVDALTGASKALDDQEHAARRQVELHEHYQETRDQLRMTSAELSGDPLQVAAQGRRKKLEVAFKAENDAIAAANEADKLFSPSPEKEKELRAAAAAARATANAMTEQRKQVAGSVENERALSEQQVGARTEAAKSKVYIAGEQARASEMGFGDTAGALTHTQNAETEAIRSAYNSKIGATPVGSRARAELVAERDSEIIAAQAKQGLSMGKALRAQASMRAGLTGETSGVMARLGGDTDESQRIALRERQRHRRESIAETDRGALGLDATLASKETAELENTIRRERQRDAGGSAARIGAMGGRASEAEMRGRGEQFNAAFAAASRTIQEHVDELKREAAAEKDATRQKQLLNQATAAQISGERELAAMQAEHKLKAEKEMRQTEGETAVDRLLATGQHRSARDAALSTQEREERIRIQNAQEPNWMQQLQATDRKYAAKRAMNRHDDAIQDLHLEHMTNDAEARAQGQTGVGAVYGLQEEVARMREDAGDDADKLRNVRRYSNARRAEMLRELKPVPQIHGLADWRDSLQMSIISGHSNTQAINLLRAMQGREGVSPGGAAGGNAAGGGGGGNMNAAAQNINEAANKLKNAKAIAIIK